MTLAIMAAGLGSRFGGLKQIEPIGPNGEFIIDYSIYDAIKAGFDKIVFLIKEENYQIFKDTIGKRIEKIIDVEYVFQKNDDIPSGYEVPKDRIKPWGTGHALYSLRNTINEPFAVISADDFYGREPFELLANSLQKGEFSTIGYKIGNTLSTNGSVKRGIFFTKDGYVTHIVESKVIKEDSIIKCIPLNGENEYLVDDNQTVSMLMFGFQSSIFKYIDDDIKKFFNNHQDLDYCEYFLPDIITNMIKDGIAKFKLIPTKSVWRGITYKEDLNDLKKYIQTEIRNGVYPDKLY